ncbi:hypothetical protein LAUMK35_00110 [Mycobacterium pseudokansasii]|uniref:Uncharacterized protein n=1 Tax=Mycobacterium pseudokansasii TaxID=2341080 RepID=A0A498R6A4_9MYCO|nr:hypothetical protein LAUMK35_00110 [Mycobacterium pseudokansasii]VAZ87580.1 hypothetical protein LAUMK21_00108 [Mycobacterium pseudokansasii]VBA56913.1 hypothetical protein LAUMK142_05730 [Mycobacterium pseudokansasii]
MASQAMTLLRRRRLDHSLGALYKLRFAVFLELQRFLHGADVINWLGCHFQPRPVARCAGL